MRGFITLRTNDMKIMVISAALPTKKYPLNGVFEYQQALSLSRFLNLTYLSIDLRSFHRIRKFGRYLKTVNPNLKVVEWSIPTFGRFIPPLFSSFVSNCIIQFETKKKGYSLLHFHFGEFALNFSYYLNKTDLITILTEHSSNILLNKDNTKFVRKMSTLYRLFDKVIAVSPHLNEILKIKYNVVNLVQISNMVSSMFEFRSDSMKNDLFTFISVSSIDVNKNAAMTIEAFKEEFEAEEGFRLIVIGDGPLLSELQTKYASENILFLGYLSRELVALELSKSHVFALPSILETFGVVYIEAMASGLPVIANRSGGPEYFVNDRNGILLTENTITAMRDAMRNIYENYDQYDQKSISELIIKHYSEEVISLKLVKLYKDLHEGETI